MTEPRSTITREYVRVEITETQGETITADAVDLAFMTAGVPGDSDWRTGFWETPPRWHRTAAILVGPGALELDPGIYTVWYRFTDDAERPARPAGTLAIE